MSEITVAIESNGQGQIIARYDLTEIQEKAYQQGRADKEKELSELPNEYSEKLWKIAFEKGFKKGVEDTQMRIDTLREDAIEEYKKALNKEFEKVDKKFLHWLDFVEMYNKVAEQLKEKHE